MHVVNAQLPILPAPLGLLHGPLLVTVETWSSGSVVARIPALALYAEADSDVLALDALAVEIGEFAIGVARLLSAGKKISGPLEHQWMALCAMVDTSGLS